MKKLFLVISFSTLGFAAEKTYQVAQVEKSKFEEIDAYIASFNEIFRLADKYQKQPAMILMEKAVPGLKDEEKKLFLSKLVTSPGSYLKLVRSGASVFLMHHSSGIRLATIDASHFSETGVVRFDGRDVPLRAIMAEASLKVRATLLLAEMDKTIEAKKTAVRRVLEKVLFVVILPLTILTACGEGSAPAATDSSANADAYKAAVAGTGLATETQVADAGCEDGRRRCPGTGWTPGGHSIRGLPTLEN